MADATSGKTRERATGRFDGVEEIEERLRGLRSGAESLRAVIGRRLAEAWWRATGDLPASVPAGLRRDMAAAAELSLPGLDAALGTVARGVRTAAARRLLEDTPPPPEPRGPAVVVLPSNVPGLALQSLLPALAARRPLLLKTPSSEPGFTPWLLRRLADAEPGLGPALAAASWRGGERAVEKAVLPAVERTLAYGGDGALADLRSRSETPFVGHGHRISLGLVTPEAEIVRAAQGLSRDIALFDQRGCLSVHSVFVFGGDESGSRAGDESGCQAPLRAIVQTLGQALVEALAERAHEWPPGPASAARLAAVRAARDEALMAGHEVPELPLRQGTVILERPGALESPERLEGPGLRTVRVVTVASPSELLSQLRPWAGRLQGVAMATSGSAAEAREFEGRLHSLGVSRVAAPGRLQEVDAATWRNGGVEPLALFA